MSVEKITDSPEDAARGSLKQLGSARRSQCQCCASPLGEPISMDRTTRIVCQSCLGFIARWWVELGQASKATIINGRHSAMKDLDAWIVAQHPEDQHALMVTADKMNDALIKLDAPNAEVSGQPPGE